jgi:hypothetical protein
MSHKKYREEKNCLNCGTEVIDRFCHHCGQENIETHENFFNIAWHFITDYFHFDSKFFRSLIPLFTKPGFLTKEYWEGRRMRYIPPLRLFFFVTIIFMISITYFYKHFGDDVKKSMVKADPGLAKYDSTYIANMEDRVRAREITEAKVKEARQLRKLNKGIDDFFVYLKYVTFFLLPIYALLFKLLYIRRKTFYVDHLVYVMHLQSFVYSLFTVALLVPFIFPQSYSFIVRFVGVALFIYVGISLYYLYRQRWWKTLLKTMLATFLLFFTTLLVMIGYAAVDAIFIQQ